MAKMTAQERSDIVIDSVAVLIGDYHINRKRAAMLLLKAFLPHEILNGLFESACAYPFDRNDPRVRAWTKDVLSRGKCENCGSADGLEAHHVIRWADYPQGRIDPQNGCCLCHECHANEHIADGVYYMMKAKRRKEK